MGRRLDGAGPRDKLVAFRVNAEEEQEMEVKRLRRGLDVSNYFRTLMHEDDGQ